MRRLRPSLVKFAARLSALSTGSSSSSPTSDQVPDDTYAKSRSSAGTPTTADAVSWEPTAITRTSGASPVRAATSDRSVPTTSPGSISGGNRSAGISSASSTSFDHDREEASSSPVVEAFVISAAQLPGQPVRQQVRQQDGMPSRSQSGPRCSAAS